MGVLRLFLLAFLLSALFSQTVFAQQPEVGVSRLPAGAVNPNTDVVSFTAISSDADGILWTLVAYRTVPGQFAQVVCQSTSCSGQAGPFSAGTVVEYYGQARDASPQGNLGATQVFSLTVGASASPTPTATPSPSPSPSPTPTATASPSPSATPSPTPTPAPGAPPQQPGLQCVALLGDVVAQANEFVDVVLSYSNASSQPPFGQVNCGNGLLANAQCIATSSSSGLCVAECFYQTAGTYTVSANAGAACAAASVTIQPAPTPTPSPPSPTAIPPSGNGVLIVRVQDASSGGAIRNAVVTVNNFEAFTDSFGEARFELAPGTVAIAVAANGFSPASNASALIASGVVTIKTVRLSALTIFQACDVTAELVATPSCSGNEMKFKLRLTSTANTTTDAYLNYSSAVTLDLPSQVQITSSNPVVTLDVNARINNLAGELPPVEIAVKAKAGCVSRAQVPVCKPKGISFLQQPLSQKAVASSRACASLALRNYEAADQLVYAEATGPFSPAVTQPRFILGAFETKGIEVCVDFPTTASGGVSYAVNARGVTGNATAVATFDVTGQNSFSFAPDSCAAIPSTGRQTVSVNYSNFGSSGDYSLEAVESEDGLEASVVQPLAYGFGAGSTRQFFVQVVSTKALAGNHFVLLNLREHKTGALVHSRQLCLAAPTQQAAVAVIQPNGLVVPAGQTARVNIAVENTGNAFTKYFLTSGNSLVTLSPSSLDLDAGGAASVTATIATASSTPRGKFTAQASVFARNASDTLVAQPVLEFTVVDGRELEQRTVLKGTEVKQAFASAAQTSEAKVPVIVRNNNGYAVALDVYAANLPPGVVALPKEGVGLQAFEEKTVFLTIQLQNAPKGSFVSKVRASGAGEESSEAPLFLRVGLPPGLAVDAVAGALAYSFNASAAQTSFSVNATNNEPGALTVAAGVQGLPANYTASAAPATLTLQTGETTQVQFTITAPTSELQDVSAAVVLTAQDGREKRLPVELRPLQASRSTGLFILGFGDDPLVLGLFVLLLLAGAGIALYSKGLAEQAQAIEKRESE